VLCCVLHSTSHHQRVCVCVSGGGCGGGCRVQRGGAGRGLGSLRWDNNFLRGCVLSFEVGFVLFCIHQSPVSSKCCVLFGAGRSARRHASRVCCSCSFSSFMRLRRGIPAGGLIILMGGVTAIMLATESFGSARSIALHRNAQGRWAQTS
jgi:hypothetical protein